MIGFSRSDQFGTLFLRFKLSAVDWLAIGNSEDRIHIALTLAPLVKYLHVVGDSFRYEDGNPLPSRLPARYTESFELAESLARDRQRPGARDMNERRVVWETQKAATMQMVEDDWLQRAVKYCSFYFRPGLSGSGDFQAAAYYLNPANVEIKLSQVDRFKGEYLVNENSDALDELVHVRAKIAAALLELGRLTRAARVQAELPFFDQFEQAISVSFDERRYTSPLYTTLVSTALLAGVRLTLPAQAELFNLRKMANGVVSGAAETALTQTEEALLGLPTTFLKPDQSEELERLAYEACDRAVAECGTAMVVVHESAIALMAHTVHENLHPSPHFDAHRSSGAELLGRYVCRSPAERYSTDEISKMVALDARIWANLTIILLQIVNTAVHPDVKLDAVVANALVRYRQAIALLDDHEEESLGAGHLLRFESHAISRRTVARYEFE